MEKIYFEVIKYGSLDIELISDWYFYEWNIKREKTINQLNELTNHAQYFQVLMKRNDEPIATGGIYSHVSLLDKETNFKIYPYWLALVYTIPSERGKGYGAMLCDFIEKQALERNMSELHLFTHTAENLYKRLGWHTLENMIINKKNIAIMRKIIVT